MYVRDYLVEMHLLPQEDGGNWHVTVLDLPGCMSDGSTVDEAAVNVADAIDCWIETARSLGKRIPDPVRAAERLREQT